MQAEQLFADVRAKLAAAQLSVSDIVKCNQRIEKCADELATLSGVKQERMAVLGSVNIDYLSWAIACAAAQEGVLPIIYRCPYGAFVQEVFDPSSSLHRFKPTVVVIAADWRDAVEVMPPSVETDVAVGITDKKLKLFEQIWGTLQNSFGCKIIQHLCVTPGNVGRGVADRQSPSSVSSQVERFNTRVIEAGTGKVTWIELDRFAHEVGTAHWESERLYHTAKVPFDPRFLPNYLPYFRAAWRSSFATAKKVLVLDLDNTLWGGVIGDDGVDGIKLGPGSLQGEAFEAWQSHVAQLQASGVILAVCSKNDPEIGRSGFDHSFSRLKADDFAVIECSWDDKASGLRKIAKRLNLGIESFVFVDDNPAECELVARELPEVAVIPLGNDPTDFIALLERGHWFDLAAYTSEDFARKASYSAMRQIEESKQAAPDMGSFLLGLDMVGNAYVAAEADLERVAQLEYKTNQFNLTTRRYSAAAVKDFMLRDDVLVLAFRVKDRLADHGLISTLIAVREGDDLRIDSWLMSCRVFSRTCEIFMIKYLASLARDMGVTRIYGEYLPTAKNGVVADLYPRLGFTLDEASSRWVRPMSADAFSELPCFIEDANARELPIAV